MLEPAQAWLAWTLWFLAGVGLLTLARSGWGWLRHRLAPAPEASCSLLLLFRNQAPVVEGLVRHALDLEPGAGGAVRDVVLVDHGSTDETAAILHRLARRQPGVRVVEVPAAGSGAEAGLFLCRSPVVVVYDATGQVEADAIRRSLTWLLRGPGGRSGQGGTPVGRRTDGLGGVRPGTGRRRPGTGVSTAVALPRL